jgi:putative membrane protein
MFEKQSKSGQDTDLKAWAAKTLPTLREHQQLAQTTNASVNK